jgi:hypothetical protein
MGCRSNDTTKVLRVDFADVAQGKTCAIQVIHEISHSHARLRGYGSVLPVYRDQFMDVHQTNQETAGADDVRPRVARSYNSDFLGLRSGLIDDRYQIVD